MLNLERIPDQVGYLVLTEDGAVVAVRIFLQIFKSIIVNCERALQNDNRTRLCTRIYVYIVDCTIEIELHIALHTYYRLLLRARGHGA